MATYPEISRERELGVELEDKSRCSQTKQFTKGMPICSPYSPSSPCKPNSPQICVRVGSAPAEVSMQCPMSMQCPSVACQPTPKIFQGRKFGTNSIQKCQSIRKMLPETHEPRDAIRKHWTSFQCSAQCGNTTFQWVPNVGTLHFNGCPMWEHYISMGAQLGFVVRKFVAEFRVLAHKWKTTITSMPACNVLETTK